MYSYLTLKGMAVAVVSSSDAIYGLGRKSRVFLCTMMAAFALFWCIVYRYFREDQDLHVAFIGFGAHFENGDVSEYDDYDSYYAAYYDDGDGDFADFQLTESGMAENVAPFDSDDYKHACHGWCYSTLSKTA